MYRITAQTLEVTELGHLTDRYSKAVEQLGDDKLDVRLGGIYALEQIVFDSPRQRDQATIVEVLSAFVRIHSDPLYQYKSSLLDLGELRHVSAQEQQRLATEYVADLDKPPVDVQAAVTVLGRLPLRKGATRGDLSAAQLVGADLFKADLSSVNLAGANLTKAVLNEATLTKSLLLNADLSNAFLINTDLTETRLFKANLTEAWLLEANLTAAIFIGAQLSKANLTGANITMADFTNVDLTNVQGLTQEAVNKAKGDRTTRLPDGIQHPSGWPERSFGLS